MLPEIAAAVGFLSSLLRTRGCVSEQRLKVFSGALQEALTGEPTPVASRHSGSAPLPAKGVFLHSLGSRLPSRSRAQLSVGGSSGGAQRARTLVLECDSDSWLMPQKIRYLRV